MDGGLLIEGSADPTGALLTAWLIRRTGAELRKEALLFFTDCSRGFAPIQFRDWLPRDLRRDVRPGTWIHALLADWSQVWEQARMSGATTPERSFVESTQLLSRRRAGFDPSLVRAGMVIVAPAPAGRNLGRQA